MNCGRKGNIAITQNIENERLSNDLITKMTGLILYNLEELKYQFPLG